MYVISVITGIGPIKKYVDSIDGYFKDIQKQTIFKWTEHIIVYTEWHEIFDRYTHLENVFFYKETGRSIYEAWNQGIKEATTPFVTNWNVDDRRYPKANEKKWIILKKNEDIGLVTSWLDVTNKENDDVDNPEGKWTTFKWLSTDDPNWNKACQGGPDPMWRRELHEKYGYFDGQTYKVAADWEMWMRFRKNGVKMHLIKESLGLYYLNPVGVSTSEEGRPQNIKDNAAILEKYGVI